MLDGAADPDRDVQLRPHRHPRLPDLELLRDPPAVHGLAGGRDGPAEEVRELLEHREDLRISEAVSAAHDDVRLVRPHPALPDELLELEELRVEVRLTEFHDLVHNLPLADRIVMGREEHVPPGARHLGAVLLAQDVREGLPAEARADHVEVPIVVEVELHAVRGEPRLEHRMEPPAEVPPVLRRSVEDDLGLVEGDQGRHHLRERA